MGFSGSLDDRVAIRELLERYADAVFRRDAAQWGDCWTHDGVWRLMGMEIKGREAIIAAWTQAMAAFEVAAFFVQPGALAIDGATAQGRSWTHEVLKARDGSLRRVVGAYEDRFVKEADGWRFSARSFHVVLEG